jgi:sulfonate transport system substrate-binding protein
MATDFLWYLPSHGDGRDLTTGASSSAALVRRLPRRLFCAGLIAAAAVACKAPGDGPAAGRPAPPRVRVGYQKSSMLVLLRWKGTLEAPLVARGSGADWAEFPSGPALIEALNAERLDFGYVGEAPPIFGQAASPNLVYVAVERSSPLSEAILVRQDSALHTVADLKGKTVALNKGSNVHYFLVRALEKAGLQYSDVKLAFLAPADARAAFENGTVDAWVIWDPYLASAQVSANPRVLSTGEGIVDNYGYYIARRQFVEREPELSRLVLEQIRLVDTWAREHRDEAATYLGQVLGIDQQAIRLSVGRAAWGVGPITDDTVERQQRIADTFLRVGLLERPIRVRDAIAAPLL